MSNTYKDMKKKELIEELERRQGVSGRYAEMSRDELIRTGTAMQLSCDKYLAQNYELEKELKEANAKIKGMKKAEGIWRTILVLDKEDAKRIVKEISELYKKKMSFKHLEDQ